LEASCAFCKNDLAEQFKTPLIIEIKKEDLKKQWIKNESSKKEHLTEEENDKLYDYLKPIINRGNNYKSYKL
jgi:translation initiation factor IF-2